MLTLLALKHTEQLFVFKLKDESKIFDVFLSPDMQ